MFCFPFLFPRKPKKTEFQILMATLAKVQTDLNLLHEAITRKLASKDAEIAALQAQIATPVPAPAVPAATEDDLESIDATILALTAQAA